MNTVKMLTFRRKGPFELTAEFAEEAPLLPMTCRELGKYKVELPEQPEDGRNPNGVPRLELVTVGCVGLG